MAWKTLCLSWGMVHGVGFLCGVQFPRPSATCKKGRIKHKFVFFPPVGLNVRDPDRGDCLWVGCRQKRRAKHFCHFNWLCPTIVASPLELAGNSGAPPRQADFPYGVI